MGYRAPSWSWASLGAPVSWGMYYKVGWGEGRDEEVEMECGNEDGERWFDFVGVKR